MEHLLCVQCWPKCWMYNGDQNRGTIVSKLIRENSFIVLKHIDKSKYIAVVTNLQHVNQSHLLVKTDC